MPRMLCAGAVCVAIVLLVLLALLPKSDAYYLPVADTSAVYPLLVAADSGAPIRWATGATAQLHAASEAVRVSDRGVRFVSSPARLLDRSKWVHTPCSVGQGFFCETVNGSVLFPESPAAAVVSDQVSLVTDPFVQGVAKRGCIRHSQRIVLGGSASYTMTLCDITQKGFEVVLDSDTQTAFLKRRADKDWIYILISVCAVVLVTCLAQDVSFLVGNADDTPSPVLMTLCTILLVSFSLVIDTNYIVLSDQFFETFLVVYVTISVVLWVVRMVLFEYGFVVSAFGSESASGSGSAFGSESDSGSGKGGCEPEQGVPFNVVVASLLFALCRMYSGVECQYILPLVFLLAFRTIHKAVALFHYVIVLSWRKHAAEDGADPPYDRLLQEAVVLFSLSSTSSVLGALYSAVTALDFVLLAVTHQYGFRPLFRSGLDGDVYFVATVLAAVLIVVVIWERGRVERKVEPGKKIGC